MANASSAALTLQTAMSVSSEAEMKDGRDIAFFRESKLSMKIEVKLALVDSPTVH